MKYRAYEKSFWDTKKLFQILLFYNVFIEKPKIKHLSSIELLHELPFYDELGIVKKSKAFEGYARSYRDEIIDSRDPLVQLEVGKSSIKDLFKDLLNEMKSFKYQITVTLFLCKHKIDRNIEYSPVYFNSATKTVINSEYYFDKSFQEILYSLGNWINKGSRWIIESIESDYVNISAYSPLIGTTYTELPDKLKNPKKDLINIKNSDNKCFLWCHIRHLNLIKTNPQRITKKYKEMISKLNYEGIKFPISKKDYYKIEMQNSICINVFCYENRLTYLVYLSDPNFKDCLDLLLRSN